MKRERFFDFIVERLGAGGLVLLLCGLVFTTVDSGRWGVGRGEQGGLFWARAAAQTARQRSPTPLPRDYARVGANYAPRSGDAALAGAAQNPVTARFGLDSGGVVFTSDANTQLARGTRAALLRLAILWYRLEPDNTLPDQYRWDRIDPYVNRVLAAGFRPTVMFMGNPAWAANTPCGPIDTTDPAMVQEFWQVLNALAARYPGIELWTLYNEPDNSTYPRDNTGGCFGDLTTGDLNGNGVADYAEYAEMLATARQAIRAANPNAQLALGEFAYDDFDARACPPHYPGGCPEYGHFDYYFLPKLFDYIAKHPRPEGAPYADLLYFHYYDIYGTYWELQPAGARQHGIQAKAAVIRKLMQAYGLDLPMAVTETGAQDAWLGKDGQSKCLVITMVRGVAAGLEGIVWWTFRDMPQLNWYYGLVDADNRLKPSYLAYQTLVKQLEEYKFAKPVRLGRKIEGYRFVKGNKERLVLWSSKAISDGKAPCAYPRAPRRAVFAPNVKRVRVVDMYGQVRTIRDNSRRDLDATPGTISFKVDGAPLYVTTKR